jgi:hypothetical protein
LSSLENFNCRSPLDGSYSLPALAPSIYQLSASLSDFVADQRVISLSAATAQQNFLLNPLPAPPQITTAGSTPPIAQVPDDIQGADLVVFNGAVFQAGLPLDPTKMTVVLTHGWVPSWSPGFPDWPTKMALAMNAKGISAFANIVAWDWHQAATTSWPPPWNVTPDQGVHLGQVLYQLLGSGYSQPIHFLGHSLGTLVNAEAANYLTGAVPGNAISPAWEPQNMEITLFDEAEIAIEANQILVYGIANGFAGGPSASSLVLEPGYVSPIPLNWASYAWIDNYISAFGLYHPEAVNVYLSEANSYFSLWDRVDLLSLIPTATQMHGYPTFWYQASVTNAADSQMGFINSFEQTYLSAESVFPPESFAVPPGTQLDYQQNGDPTHYLDDPADFLGLQSVPGSEAMNWNAPFLPLALPAGVAHLFIGEQVESTILITGTQFAVSAIGNATANIAQGTTIAADNAFNFLSSQTSQAFVDLGNQPQLLLALTTAAAPSQARPQTPPPGGGSGASNTPACVWMTLSVPANAPELTFNFTASGNCAQDSLVFGVNSNSLFSITLAYLTAGQTYSSGPIDISAYADASTNQFFFGVLGGTSTNATVDVADIQFVSFTLPCLSIAQAAGTTTLSWPSSANGYTLQSTTDLSLGTWEDVTNVPSLFGGFFTVANSWSDQTRFFKLTTQ